MSGGLHLKKIFCLGAFLALFISQIAGQATACLLAFSEMDTHYGYPYTQTTHNVNSRPQSPSQNIRDIQNRNQQTNTTQQSKNQQSHKR